MHQTDPEVGVALQCGVHPRPWPDGNPGQIRPLRWRQCYQSGKKLPGSQQMVLPCPSVLFRRVLLRTSTLQLLLLSLRPALRAAPHGTLSPTPRPARSAQRCPRGASAGGHFVPDLRVTAGSAPSLLPPRGEET